MIRSAQESWYRCNLLLHWSPRRTKHILKFISNILSEEETVRRRTWKALLVFQWSEARLHHQY